ncbi:hypothetical protein Tco_0832362 [Tanacetum coccineum]
MDDQPMWVADCVVAPSPAISLPETANEFAIRGNHLTLKSKPIKRTVAFADEGLSNPDTDKIMARMDAMTMKMNAQYKEMKSRLNLISEHDKDDQPTTLEAEAKFMQTFRHTHFYNDYRNLNRDNWRSSGRNDYNRDNYQ